MRVRRIPLAFLLALGLASPVASQAPPPIALSATWLDRSDNEEGFRVEQVTPAITPRPVKCDAAVNIRQCSWTEADTLKRCYVVYAYNSAGKSADSAPACTGQPIAPSSLVINVVAPPPTPGSPIVE